MHRIDAEAVVHPDVLVEVERPVPRDVDDSHEASAIRITASSKFPGAMTLAFMRDELVARDAAVGVRVG